MQAFFEKIRVYRVAEHLFCNSFFIKNVRSEKNERRFYYVAKS